MDDAGCRRLWRLDHYCRLYYSAMTVTHRVCIVHTVGGLTFEKKQVGKKLQLCP